MSKCTITINGKEYKSVSDLINDTTLLNELNKLNTKKGGPVPPSSSGGKKVPKTKSSSPIPPAPSTSTPKSTSKTTPKKATSKSSVIDGNLNANTKNAKQELSSKVKEVLENEGLSEDVIKEIMSKLSPIINGPGLPLFKLVINSYATHNKSDNTFTLNIENIKKITAKSDDLDDDLSIKFIEDINQQMLSTITENTFKELDTLILDAVNNSKEEVIALRNFVSSFLSKAKKQEFDRLFGNITDTNYAEMREDMLINDMFSSVVLTLNQYSTRDEVALEDSILLSKFKFPYEVHLKEVAYESEEERVKFLRDVIEGMDYYVLNAFRNMNNVDRLSNAVTDELYTTVRDQLFNHFNDIYGDEVNDVTNYDTTIRFVRSFMNDVLDTTPYAEENFKHLIEFHFSRLSQFKMKLNDDGLFSAEEDQETRDDVFDKAAINFDTKDTMPPAVKIFISGGKVTDVYGQEVANDLQFPKRVDFGKVYNYISNRLAGNVNDIQVLRNRVDALIKENEDMLERFQSYNPSYEDHYTDTLKALRDALDYKDASSTEEQLANVNFVNKLFTTFSTFSARLTINNYNSSKGKFEIVDQNSKKTRSLISSRISSAFDSKMELNPTDRVRRYKPSEVKNVATSLRTLLTPSTSGLSLERMGRSDHTDKLIKWSNSVGEQLSKLGINSDNWYRVFNTMSKMSESSASSAGMYLGNSDTLINAGYDFVKVMEEWLTYIGNSENILLTNNNFVGMIFAGKFDDTARSYLKSLMAINKVPDKEFKAKIDVLSKVVNEFLDAEMSITTTVASNQNRNINGDNVFGITKNTAISRYVNGLNYAASLNTKPEREAAFKKHVPLVDCSWGMNSVFKKAVVDGKNLKFVPGFLNGMNSEQDQKEFKNFTPAERLANMIVRTMKGTMFFFRAADRTVEFTTEIMLNGKPSNILEVYNSGSNKGVQAKAVDVFKQYFIDEMVTRAIAMKNVPGFETDQMLSYDKNGKNARFFDEDMLSAFKSDTIQTLLTDAAKEDVDNIRKYVEDYVATAKVGEKSFSDIFSTSIKSYLKNRLKSLKEFATTVGLRMKDETGQTVYVGLDSDFDGLTVDDYLTKFIVLSELNYIEQTKLITGDPAYYDNEDNWFKRMKITTANFKESVATPELDEYLNTNNHVIISYGKEGNKKTYTYTMNGNDPNNLIRSFQEKAFYKDGSKLVSFNDPTLEVKYGPGFRLDYLLNSKTHDSTFEVLIADDNVVKAQMFSGQDKAMYESITSISKSNNKIVLKDAAGKELKDSNFSEFLLYLADELYNDATKGKSTLNSKDLAKISKVVAKKLKAFIKPYYKLEEADGESYASLHFYRDLMQRNEGMWSPIHEKAYVKMSMGLPLDTKEVALFRKVKSLGSGNMEKRNAHPEAPVSPVVYKHSVQLIHPAIVGKDTMLAKLHDFLEKTATALVVYGSANKVGQIIPVGGRHKLYSADGSSNFEVKNGKKTINGQELVTQKQSFKNFGIQVDLKPVYKDKSTAGSQWRKLVISNMFDNGKPRDFTGSKQEWEALSENAKLQRSSMYEMIQRYLNTQEAIYSSYMEELILELGLKEYDLDGQTAYTLNNRDGLARLLTEAAMSREYSANVLQSLAALNKEGNYIEYLVDSDKIESVLFALVNNRIIKEKRNGTGAPQTAVTGFEIDKRDVKIGNPILKFYRKGVDGKTLPAEVMFRRPDNPDFNKWFEKHYNNNLDALNKELDSLFGVYANNEETNNAKIKMTDRQLELAEMIKLIGFRIPTQGMNSGDFLRIRRFLPLEAADTIVVPSEIVGKSGSDFDIDKLTLYIKNFKYDGKTERLVFNGVDYNSTVNDRYNNYIKSLKLPSDLLQEFKESEKEQYEQLTSLRTDRKELISGLEETRGEINEAKEYIRNFDREGMDTFRTLIEIFQDGETNPLRQLYKSIEYQYENHSDRLVAWKVVTNELITYLNSTESIQGSTNAEVKLFSKLDEIKSDSSLKQGVIRQFELLDKYYGNVADDALKTVFEFLITTKGKKTSLLNNLSETSSLIDQIKESIEPVMIDFKKDQIQKGKLIGLTFEQFRQKTVEQQHTHKDNENNFIDVSFDILSNPMNRRQLISPISDAFLTDPEIGMLWDIRLLNASKLDKNNPERKIFDDFRTELKKNPDAKDDLWDAAKVKLQAFYKNSAGKWSNISKAEVNIMKALYFIGGKAGVGQAAVHVTNHQLATIAGLVMNVKSENILWYFEHNKTAEGLVDFSQIRNTQGDYISEILSALVNAYVDVAKDPFIFDLNAGNDNANLQFMLLRSGATSKFVYRFMSHPAIKVFQEVKAQITSPFAKSINKYKKRQYDNDIIREALVRMFPDKANVIKDMLTSVAIDGDYISVYTMNNSTFIPAFQNAKRIGNLLRSVTTSPDLSSFESIMKTFTTLLTGEQSDLLMLQPTTVGQADGQYINTETPNQAALNMYKYALSENRLENALLGNEYLSKNEKLDIHEAFAIMDMYVAWQQVSRLFQAQIRGASADTAGLGKSTSITNKHKANRNLILRSNTFKNYDKMFTKTIVKTPTKVVDTFSVAYDDVIFFNKNAELKVALNNIVSTIAKNKGIYKDNDLSSLEKIVKSRFNQAILNMFVKELNIEKTFKRLIPSSNESSVVKKLKDKIDGVGNAFKMVAPRFAEKLQFHLNKGSYYTDLKDFNNKLYVDDTNPGFDYFTFDAGNLNVTERADLEEELRKLKNRLPNVYKLILDIAIMQYGTGGTPNFDITLFPEEDVRAYKSLAFKKFSEFIELSKKNNDEVYEQFLDIFTRNVLNSYIGRKYNTRVEETGTSVVKGPKNENGERKNFHVYSKKYIRKRDDDAERTIQDDANDVNTHYRYVDVRISESGGESLYKKILVRMNPIVEKPSSFKTNTGQTITGANSYHPMYVSALSKYPTHIEPEIGNQTLESIPGHPNLFTPIEVNVEEVFVRSNIDSTTKKLYKDLGC